ncbi:MAG: THUMP domain-containing protein [Candidatus Bathyarchaeota archaeon]|nr:THUMP domain-containing protein [Candidatus Bathyarchaeota archaeon]
MRDFNLLVSTARGFENAACAEIRFLLEEIGDKDSAVNQTGVSGLIAAKTALHPLDAIKKLRIILEERPYEFRYALRIIPIESVVRTEIEEIREAVAKLSSKIGEKETFRITVEKRFTTLHSRELIETVAAGIKRKVDLNNPEKIVLIEIVGSLTGLSVIEPCDIISVQKEKIL